MEMSMFLGFKNDHWAAAGKWWMPRQSMVSMVQWFIHTRDNMEWLWSMCDLCQQQDGKQADEPKWIAQTAINIHLIFTRKNEMNYLFYMHEHNLNLKS